MNNENMNQFVGLTAMEAKSLKLFWILSVCVLAILESVSTISTSVIRRSRDLQIFNDTLLLKERSINNQTMLFNTDISCPRDCECTANYGYRKATCKRLNLGTEKFDNDITELEINNAEIDIQLDDFIFKKLGLSQIERIKIQNSTITSVGFNAFHDLPNLYAVILSNNRVKDIHPETFATNRNLLILILSHNRLKFPASLYFINTSSVQEFDISYCNMRYITNNTLLNMPGLIYLNLAGNNLSELEADTFKTLLDLEELDLSDNNLKSLPKHIFSENTELATLHIQRNPIESVYELQIPYLLTLNAGQTNIKFVGPSMFNSMTYIANLNLSGNGIEKIHNQAFHKLVELNYLDLSYNNLDVISEILIKYNIELNILNISNNPRLKHLPADGFNCSAGRFHIDLFDASNCGLEQIYEDSLKTFYVLTQINLSHNKIRFINRLVFSRSPSLTEINLAYNLLTNLDNKVFEINNRLEKLNLQGNPLKVFSVEVFLHTPMLTWLDMSHANLTSLWKKENNQPTKVLLNRLKFLNVSHNHINEIKQIDLVTLEDLGTLDISNNLLACTKEFKNTINWLNNHHVSPPNNYEFTSSKETVDIFTWDHYARKICGGSLSSTLTPLSVIQSTEADEDILKFRNVLDDSNLFNNTDIINGDTEQNKYVQDDKDDTYDDDNKTDNVLSVNDTFPKLLNSESILNTNNNRGNNYVWPIITSVIITILILIIIIIFIKKVYKKRNGSRRTNLMHQRSQDSEITSGMPLIATYTSIPHQENESVILANL